MADVWEISRYVEAHPDNYAQRWRLAKKLYLAWEYRLALEHLLILKNEWEDRANVSRYLAATYYRLTRYTDAVDELEATIEKWPDEIGLREQLAHTFEVLGKKESAAATWEEIAEMSPEHAFAERTAQRLRARGSNTGNGRTSNTTAPLGDATPYPSIHSQAAPQILCPECGTPNKAGLQRCWRCQATLRSVSRQEIVHVVPTSSSAERDYQSLIYGIALVLTLALGVYLTLRALFPTETPDEVDAVAVAAYDFLTVHLSATRIVIGVLLLLGWPIALHCGVYLAGLQNIAAGRLNLLGALFASVVYLLSWLPPAWIPLGAIIFVPGSFALLVYAFRLRLRHTFLLWSVQGFIALLVPLTIFSAMHGLSALVELPLVFREAQKEARGTRFTMMGKTPLVVDLRWDRLDSEWLTHQATDLAFTVESGPRAARLFVELLDERTTYVFREIDGNNARFVFRPIEPDHDYQVIVHGVREDGVDVTLSLRATLPLAEAQNTPRNLP
ncbi:MAG: hypothetical protein IIB38_03130 [Candidatus Hydrogenedentes bacterium]|nr:hypothetical protein [Candidatus Hydrogenedentota bacterium]